ncbi:MAG TPA: PASTA domain-containing protein [Nocardioides sp.]
MITRAADGRVLLVLTALTGAVLLVVGMVGLLSAPAATTSPVRPVAAGPEPATEAATGAIAGAAERSDELAVADGTRLVAVGRVALAVPERWSDAEQHCGTPRADTVLGPEPNYLLCGASLASGLSWVQFGTVPLPGDPSGTPEEAPDEALACHDGTGEEIGFRVEDVGGCDVWIVGADQPSVHVASTLPTDAAREVVAEVATSYRVLRHHLGLPPPGGVGVNGSVGAGWDYVAWLRGEGLDVTVVEVEDDRKAGDVLAVEPTPGTLLANGAPVTVTLVAGAR